MRRLFARAGGAIWTRNLVVLAAGMFLARFGEGLQGGVRTNFFVDTLGLTGAQVLWLEGIREIPGLALILIAAATMHLALSHRTAVSVLVMGVGYILYASVRSYTALLAVAIVASFGMLYWLPLNNALGLSLSTKERSGRILGLLSSVGSLATIAGMGVISLIAGLFPSLNLRSYYVAGGAVIVIGALLYAWLPPSIGSTEIRQPRLLLKRRYWLYYVLTFFQGSRKQVLHTFGALVLVQQFGLQVWEISALFVASALVNFASAPLLGYLLDRFGERKTLSISYLLLVLCCVGFATLGSVWVLAVLFVAIKLLVVLGIGLPTYVNRIAPPEELTPTLSAGLSINHVTSVAMPIVAGVLLPIIHYTGIFWGTAALILLSVPFALALDVNRVPQPQASPVAAE